MSEETEEAPLCSECGQPMEPTSSENAQLWHGGVPYACQSNTECSEYAPTSIGSYKAVDLEDAISIPTHNDGHAITLRCEECGTNTVFSPDGLKADDRITCSACNADIGSAKQFVAIKEIARKG